MISMGSGLDTPFDISEPTKAAVACSERSSPARATRAPQRLLHRHLPLPLHLDFGGGFPAEVPMTSIYSRGDGVVLVGGVRRALRECVEVSGSHIGLAFNRKAYREVGRALARARRRVQPG